MPLYKVSAKEYFDKLPSSVKYSSKSTFTGTYENIQKCKVPITNLFQRFITWPTSTIIDSYGYDFFKKIIPISIKNRLTFLKRH